MKESIKVNLGSANFNYEGTPVSLENITFEWEGEGNVQEIAQVENIYKSLIAVITNNNCRSKKEVTEYETDIDNRGVKTLKPVKVEKKEKKKTEDEMIYDKWNQIVFNSTKNFKQVSISRLELDTGKENEKISIALTNNTIDVVFKRDDEPTIYVYIYADRIAASNININVLNQFIDELEIEEEDKNFLKKITQKDN
jgi:hypothetical protein